MFVFGWIIHSIFEEKILQMEQVAEEDEYSWQILLIGEGDLKNDSQKI